MERVKIKPFDTAINAFLIMWDHKKVCLKLGLIFSILYTFILSFQLFIGPSLIVSGLLTALEAMIAYYWHRMILLNSFDFKLLNIQTQKEKIISEGCGHFISIYFLIYFLYFLAIALGSYFLRLFLGDDVSDTSFMGLMAIILITASPYLIRLLLVFPATAIGHKAESFKDAWISTEDNMMRIWLAYVFVFIIVVLSVILGESVMPTPSLDLYEFSLENIFKNFTLSLRNVYFAIVWAGLNSTIFKTLNNDIEDYLVNEAESAVTLRERVMGKEEA